MKVSTLLTATVAALSLGVFGFAHVKGQDAEYTKVKASAPSAHAGRVLNVKVTLDVPAGFHVYSSKYKGDTGVPLSVKGNPLPAGYSIKSLKVPAGDSWTGHVSLTVPILVPKTAHGRVSFKLKVRYQQCNDRICLPPKNEIVQVSTSVK